MRYLLIALVINFSPLIASYGCYIGGSVGGHFTEGKQTSRAVGTFETNVINPADLQDRVFDRNASYLLYTGYYKGWESLYLAIEGTLQLGHAKFHSSQTGNNLVIGNETEFNTSSTVKGYINTVQGGADFLPGWLINSATLLYGRIGVGGATARLKTYSNNYSLIDFASGSLFLYLTNKKSFATLRAGVGLEQRLNSRFSIRSDYIFTDYGKISLQSLKTGTSVGLDTTIPVTLHSNTKMRLYDHSVTLGLSYRLYCDEPINLNSCYSSSEFQRFYLGGVLGGSMLTAKQSGSVFGERSQTNQTLYVPSQLYRQQFQGMVFLGGGGAYKRAYLGGELFASANTPHAIKYKAEVLFDNTTNNNTNYSTSSNTSVESSVWQYGFDTRPGILFTSSTLVYGRVGVSAAEIEVDSKALFTANNGTGVTWSVPKEISNHKWKAAFRVGLGVEQALTSNLHIRADYVNTYYGKISFNNTATGLDNDGTEVSLKNTLSNRLKNNALLVGLTFYIP